MYTYLYNIYLDVFGNSIQNIDNYLNLTGKNIHNYLDRDLQKKIDLFKVDCKLNNKDKYLNLEECYKKIEKQYDENDKEYKIYIMNYFIKWFMNIIVYDKEFHKHYVNYRYYVNDINESSYIMPFKRNGENYLRINIINDEDDSMYLNIIKHNDMQYLFRKYTFNFIDSKIFESKLLDNNTYSEEDIEINNKLLKQHFQKITNNEIVSIRWYKFGTRTRTGLRTELKPENKTTFEVVIKLNK